MEEQEEAKLAAEKSDVAAPVVQNYTFCEKFKMVARNITVEPIMLCFDIPYMVLFLVVQHLNLEKACRVDLQYNSSICDAMAIHNETGYAKEDEAVVQKYVATVMAYRNVLQSVILVLLVLFIGSWSDRHRKRKPCIIFPILGQLFVILGLTIATYFFYEMGIVYNVFIEAVPPALTGAAYSLEMAVFAYISSITTLEERTVRVGAVNLLVTVAGTIGAAICGVMYYELGFYGCYALTASVYTIGIVYCMIMIKDTDDRTEEEKRKDEENKKSFLRDFFDINVIKETFRTCFKDGEKNRRKKILAIIVLVVVVVGPVHGELNVFYLFVRYKFEWSEIDYSIYSTFYAIAHIVGGVFVLMLISTYLKIDDAILGLLSCLSKIIAAFVFAFAPNPTIFYIAAVIEMFNGTSYIAMRSIISKLVPANELGKIYSTFSVCESLAPLFYGPLYSFIYKHTIDVMPGAFFIAGGLFTIPSVLIFFWLHLDNQRDIREEAKNMRTILATMDESNNLDSVELNNLSKNK